ncbi:DUF4919 domain-containing protein [Fluviicola sp.]|uniref:DUF4919 domain-containing protein n=1 Tax=Fluviicola sp. TaxID=1917219 RepID=UPI0031D8CB04
MKNQFILLLLLIISATSFGQTSNEVIIPPFQDKYSEYVKKLEAGETAINYQDFRFSFIESEQFVVASGKSEEMDSLKKEMTVQMKASNSPEIIRITKQILSIDYTDMMAHKILKQTYKIIGDTTNAARYKTIQFGLLNSIVKNGDGQTCATAWPVIQVKEEYFVLQMVDAQLQEQSVDRKNGLCDRMEVKVEGKKKTYYFEITKVFEGYKKLGL